MIVVIIIGGEPQTSSVIFNHPSEPTSILGQIKILTLSLCLLFCAKCILFLTEGSVFLICLFGKIDNSIEEEF